MIKSIFSQIALAGIVLSSGILAAPGDLDPTFGGTGYVRTAFGQYDTHNQVLIQPDGKILVMTDSSGSADSNITLIRFNANSTLDTSFGTNGVAVASPAQFKEWKNSNIMVLQPDGKILVTAAKRFGGETDVRCVTTRVNSNGTLDTSFGGTGEVVTSAGIGCEPMSVKVQSDGKVVIAGRSTIAVGPGGIGRHHSWFVARLNADGSADTGFGTGGVSTTAYNINFLNVVNVFVQPDGKLVVCGDVNPIAGGSRRFAAARFNAGGGLDTTFGNSGLAEIASEPMQITSLEAEQQPDGKIVFAGHGAGFIPQLFMVRMNANGTLDSGFGTSGFVFFLDAPLSTFVSTAIAFQPDGKIIAGGLVTLNVNGFYRADVAVMRLNSNGSLDSINLSGSNRMSGAKTRTTGFIQKESVLSGNMWGSSGIITHGTPMGHEVVTGMALDGAGRIVVAGDSQIQVMPNVIESRLAVARFLGDASPYAEISGTVRSTEGLPIKNVYVTLIGGSLAQPMTALSNQFGHFSFPGLPVTESYTVSVGSKRFDFPEPAQTFMLNGNLTDVTFIGGPMQ